jgi:hypothetical protein
MRDNIGYPHSTQRAETQHPKAGHKNAGSARPLDGNAIPTRIRPPSMRSIIELQTI